jgi:hypothetical protein
MEALAAQPQRTRCSNAGSEEQHASRAQPAAPSLAKAEGSTSRQDHRYQREGRTRGLPSMLQAAMCSRNINPGTVAVPFASLADRAGLRCIPERVCSLGMDETK